MNRFSLGVPVLIALAMLLASCGTTRINRVLADPARYRSNDVQIQGRVTNVIGALNTGVYEVDDGTGTIYVLSSRGIPNKGAHVKVTGNVQQGVNLMGHSFGTVVRERSHRVRF